MRDANIIYKELVREADSAWKEAYEGGQELEVTDMDHEAASFGRAFGVTN